MGKFNVRSIKIVVRLKQLIKMINLNIIIIKLKFFLLFLLIVFIHFYILFCVWGVY